MYTLFAKDLNEELIIAAQNNDTAQLRILLAKKANVNTVNEDGFNALHLAVTHNNLAMCEELINNSININYGNFSGNTPLHMAIVHNNIDIIKLLLKSGADISRKNNRGITPIDSAVRLKQIDTLKIFANFGLEKEVLEQKISLINKANDIQEEQCRNYCKKIFSSDSFLIEAIMKYFNSLEREDARKSFINKLEALLNDLTQNAVLDVGNDLQKFYYFLKEKFYIPPYHEAGSFLWWNKDGEMNPHLINLLLKTAQNKDFNVSNPILRSLGKQDFSPFLMLMLQFNDLGKEDPEIEYKFLEKLSKIKSVNFNEQDNQWGNTLLHFMISNAESENCIRFILFCQEKKCDLNVNLLSTAYGTGALHLSIAKGYRDIDSHGEIITSFVELTKVLIKANADVNLKCAKNLYKEGKSKLEASKILGEQTPLHIACARKDIEMITLLMENNADVSIKNAEGLTPIEVLELSYDKRKAIVDSISGKGLNNFVTYNKDHASDEHSALCKNALIVKSEHIKKV